MQLASILTALGSIFERVTSGAASPTAAVGEVIGHVQTLASELDAVRADVAALKSGPTLAGAGQVAEDAGALIKSGIEEAAVFVPTLQPEVATVDGIIAIVEQLASALSSFKSSAAPTAAPTAA